VDASKFGDQIKVTRRRSYIRKPGEGIILDPFGRRIGCLKLILPDIGLTKIGFTGV